MASQRECLSILQQAPSSGPLSLFVSPSCYFPLCSICRHKLRSWSSRLRLSLGGCVASLACGARPSRGSGLPGCLLAFLTPVPQVAPGVCCSFPGPCLEEKCSTVLKAPASCQDGAACAGCRFDGLSHDACLVGEGCCGPSVPFCKQLHPHPESSE